MSAKLIFITGTDTGVGKTVLTGLLLHHLRRSGSKALAMKPFCSGSSNHLGDVEILRRIQAPELEAHEINPFFFPEPLAPLVAARRHRMVIPLSAVVERTADVARRCECLLIEGAGGLLAPLGEGYAALELIQELRCDVIVVAPNKLGTLNHTLLTAQILGRKRAISVGTAKPSAHLPLKIILMDPKKPDLSSRSNRRILRELLAPIPVFSIPFFGKNPLKNGQIEQHVKKIKKTLAQLVV